MDKSLPCRTRKISNNLTLHLKELGKKKEKMMPKVSRRKEITKIRAETDEIRDSKKKNQKRSVKPRASSLKRLTKLTNL